jgi:type VI secretion system protein ImpM
MTTEFRPDFIGYYGKLPIRGDFLRYGLPPDCIGALDDWACASLAASRARLGQQWLKVWLQAPIRRFRLGAAICGAASLIGMVMPSIDRSGRHFPLFLVAGAKDEHRLDAGVAWLDAAEVAGITAITTNTSLDELNSGLLVDEGSAVSLPGSSAPSFWWTKGSPYHAADSFAVATMPPPGMFAAMLMDCQNIVDQGEA